MDTGDFWLTYKGFWMRLWGTTSLLKNYLKTFHSYFIFIFLKIFIIKSMNKWNNFKLSSLWHLRIEYAIQIETWTLSPTLRYITWHMLCYINECYINENMLFPQGFFSFIGSDICFIHAIGCSFWVCIWAPLTYSIIGQYLNILNCYKCWCHTFCYIFVHKTITCMYLEMKLL